MFFTPCSFYFCKVKYRTINKIINHAQTTNTIELHLKYIIIKVQLWLDITRHLNTVCEYEMFYLD